VDLKDLVLSINKNKTDCPVCHHKCEASDLTHRFEKRNFYNCPVCSITFQVDFSLSHNSYKKEYFFEDYKKQYGQTYLEDFKNIQKLAYSRLKIISQMNHSSIRDKKRLLDIGCAYGPFLAESRKFGFIPSGVEIIPEAADYVKSELGFEVLSGSFENVSFDNTFDTLTMWYVIEHFTDLYLILTKVNTLLKPGGIFAFSTPNSSGITGRKSMDLFLNKSPSDHISVWNPVITSKVLSRFGFKVKQIRVTGHHPERFPGFSKIKSKSGYTIVNFISKVFSLGDTFEVYAEKMKEIND
jgi:2-polyprenyl-3-methyl-5-hydroxy-6-metoxy-1,4-benzoquinol methylase